MHERNIELLRDDAQRLLLLEIELLQRMLDEPGVIADAQADSTQTFDRSNIPKKIEVLRGEMAKLESLEMVLAVVGTMKAGKSTTINAIVGTEVLPNRNRPMTALPTLIRHTPGQTDPLLRFENNQPINALMTDLRAVINGPDAKVKLSNLDRNPDMDELLSLIEKEARFKQTYEGSDAIFWFLKSLNDLVRLSGELGVAFPFSDYDEIHEMPFIEVEFAHLREMGQTNGRLTLLDTPGPNEAGQEHLRKMLKEQLSKASAVMVVLDFTQLKSDAGEEVRRELEEVAQVAKGRVYALVNKFDQKDRNSDNEEQLKTFVAERLMPGLIQKSEVFPVSSRRGYLANRAKHEIHLHKQLPDPEKQPWVIDFAEDAFGRRWENKIADVDEVQRAAEELWEESLFSKPLENVIRSAHVHAAAFAVDSAAAKLIENGENMSSFLGIRTESLQKSVADLKGHIAKLQLDITAIEKSERSTQNHIEQTVQSVSESARQDFEQIKVEALKTVDNYFQRGKAIERKEMADLQKDKAGLGETQGLFGQGGLISALTKTLKRFVIQPLADDFPTFNPNDPMLKFQNPAEAKKLIDGIKRTVERIMSNSEKDLHLKMTHVLDEFSESFTATISANAQKIVDKMQGQMADGGFSINIKAPKVKSVSLTFTATEMLADIISEKTRTRAVRHRTSSAWGTVCSWFDTDDWGWEEYDVKETSYEIDIRVVRASIVKEISKAFEGLDQAVLTYIKTPLEAGVAEFFSGFKFTVEQIRGDLLQSIRDKESSQADQKGLAARLVKLKKHVPTALEDSRHLKAEVDSLLSTQPSVTP